MEFCLGETAFIFYTQTRTFDGASSFCQARGTTLARISSTQEQLLIEENLFTIVTSDVWIGTDCDEQIADPCDFKFVDGFQDNSFMQTPETFPWGADEPSKVSVRDRHCVSMIQTSFEWEDQSCLEEHPFLCRGSCVVSTNTPTFLPSASPTNTPSASPSLHPSNSPSRSPTSSPTPPVPFSNGNGNSANPAANLYRLALIFSLVFFALILSFFLIKTKRTNLAHQRTLREKNTSSGRSAFSNVVQTNQSTPRNQNEVYIQKLSPILSSPNPLRM
eukprot:snap_masked-scaffold_6-processed-gene-14.20-mRNA-1 protein AED:1.00 eAED:1.00 QI:0/0/0/0/1/1/2/0/274